MKNFIKENWLKIIIILLLAGLLLSNRYYFINKGLLVIKCDKFTAKCSSVKVENNK